MPKNIYLKFGFFALLFLRFSLALGQPIINFSDTTIKNTEFILSPFSLINSDTITLDENDLLIKDSYCAKGQTDVYDALHSFQSRKVDGFGGFLNDKINLGLEKIRLKGFKSDIKKLYIQIDSYTLDVYWFAVVGPSSDNHCYTRIDSRGSANGGRPAVEKQIPSIHLRHSKLIPVKLLEFNNDVLQYYDWKGNQLDTIKKFINIQQYFYKYYDPKFDNVNEITTEIINETKPVIIKPDIKKNNPITYRVKKGDTLSKISKIHHVSVSTIKKNNNLRSDIIQIGQVLKIR
ncbi:MAG: LysM peptidoglycan-binding domain-containing protein [Flavobacteriia bacterium]|nr:LysM peptidoglycan-binding domain-containing protein [Flavobacteriia bacterium]